MTPCPTWRVPAGHLDRNSSADRELDQELYRELVNIPVYDLTDRRLRHFEFTRGPRLAPTLVFDVPLERRGKLASNVQRNGFLTRKPKIQKRVMAHDSSLSLTSSLYRRAARSSSLCGVAFPVLDFF